MAGTLLSSMHQSFLGALYLITKGKLYPLWYSPYLTTEFYLSAIPAGLAVTIMALYLCVRSLNVRIDLTILSDVSRVIAPLLALWGLFRGVDLITHDATPYLFLWREETLSFWLEIVLLVIAPVILLTRDKVRNNPQYLYWTCSLIVMGFMANRLNISITGLQASSGVYYVPKWTEFATSLAVLTAVVMAFRYAVIYLDILPKNPPQQERQRWIVADTPARA
jgi:Ni/Fe-hydrogenase subunit HybB-like protein